ncbi:Cytochrome P450 [Mycena venus]|uniref:Cytochrome P450 n=1 Tax=Mycena venus TaxID=2733690 RepID=A0A8H6X2V5_9AGAR|nr:Cytochrome P450 [Mycena venus]
MDVEVLESFRFMYWHSVLVFVSACLVSWYYARTKKNPHLPPGPRGLPFIGNIFGFPGEQHWLKFAKLGDIWGDIFSLAALGQTMIIVNSVKVAEDLLGVRGANLSNRPVVTVGGELAGFNNVLPLAQYGDRVRTERKLFHQLFGTQLAMKNFIPMMSSEVHKLLRNIALNPGGLIDEIRRTTGAIALRIAYGYQLCEGPEHDPFLEAFETMGTNFFTSAAVGAFLADTIPILRSWPEWLPGGGFHTTAKMMSKQAHESVNTALDYVKKEIAARTAEPSFVSTLLEEKSQDEYLIKWAASAIAIGGSDTTASQIEAFFLAMTVYPDAQAAAQREIDRVVGNERLPDISDRSQLPYVDALCKEVIRWHVVVPLAVRRTSENYTYYRDGELDPLLIPRNSLIIANIWKMAHDPERYSNPLVFDPNRFIPTDSRAAEQDPARICFGYGRRICPGKLLAETSVFLACSAILAVFNISKACENGVVIEPHVGQTTSTASHVLPFKCVVEPRNAQTLELIQSGI